MYNLEAQVATLISDLVQVMLGPQVASTVECQLLWCGYKHEQRFSSTVVTEVLRYSETPVITTHR